MGILNVTPDSFSDGGQFLTPRKAVAHALRMEEEGSDILDVGGESTRPGARPVSVEEELGRILPVVEKLSKRLHIPISVDTSKPAVAEAAIKAGACLINDVTALRNPRMREVAAFLGVPVILMHMRGTPLSMQRNPSYRRLIPEILGELRRSIAQALESGISRKKILIDPGLGFGKNVQDNLRILKNLSAFKALGFPVVVGPSRKSFIGRALVQADGEVPAPKERVWATAAAVALSIAACADIVRVHDVKEMRQVERLTTAVTQS